MTENVHEEPTHEEPTHEEPTHEAPTHEAPIELLRPEKVASKPTISLHLLVKNGGGVVGRLLDNVGPYIDEVSAVLNDTTDDTKQILTERSARHGLLFSCREVTAKSNPEHYILDTEESYRIGQSLVGEEYKGSFTEDMMLVDWSAVRNLSHRGHCDWTLFLDADDVVADPECLPGLCALLGERGHDLATSVYHYRRNLVGQVAGSAFRERLFRNVPYITWTEKIHEYPFGATRPVHIDGNLIVTDMKDSQGAGLRIPDRNFKTLYYHARRLGWEATRPRNLLYLGMEAKGTMPALADRVLALYLERTHKSNRMEERAWAMCMRGEIDELAGRFSHASNRYREALKEHPGAKAAYRLCRSAYKDGDWKTVVDAYDLGVSHEGRVQLYDDGSVYRDASKILVAESLLRLGRNQEALALCKEAVVAFPQNEALKRLHGRISKICSVKEGP